MARPMKALLVFGTRPETIKLAPVWLALQAAADFEVRAAVSGQHRDMLRRALGDFGWTPEYDLDIMRENQDLFHVTSRALDGLRPVMEEYDPDCVLVQGDTTTTFVGALAAFYRQKRVGHVEAGLRTGLKYAPFPEEINRRLTGAIADFHFAPTDRARQNLAAENVDNGSIWVTGNTGIDALLWILENRKPAFESVLAPEVCEALRGPYILLTTHRRESFGQPLQRTMDAIVEICRRFPDHALVFPVHPNPNVRRVVEERLRGLSRVHLIDPLDYVHFCHLMNGAVLILTDSGGVQEEAPSLGKPVLVLRDTTERPEGVEAGVARLVGTDTARIVDEACRLLGDSTARAEMSGRPNPYGDGKAAGRIVEILRSRLAAGAA
ncbi:MAG: UDP-N-acetylglucosamine 2-epimerase (non-hydrolyzing) [Betaproteobacteria bacterium]|nr:UDP-N-acetylglucosamine 2-epimerase (non-hydrolyzing) [Betaproteobacteria bacterium]